MASISYDVLQRSLKNGEIAPVYYCFGPEDALKDEAVRQMLERALDPALRDLNLDQRSVSQLDGETLDALLNTLPMMGGRRLVILRDVEGLKRKPKVKAVLDGYLEHPSSDTVLILVQGSAEPKADPHLTRHSLAVEFASLPPERVVRWIAHQASLRNLTLAPEAAAHLFDAVGNDLGTIRMELDKIASLSIEGAVGVDEVAALVGVRRGETLFDWRDLVMAGDLAKALPLTGALLEQSNMSGVKMVSALGTAVTGMGLARYLYDRGAGRGLQEKILRTLFSIRPYGLPEWKQESEKWSRWAPLWPIARVRAGLRALLVADQALKSTRISDERGVVVDLVIQLAAERWGEAA